DRRGGDGLFVFVPERRVGVAISIHVLLGREHPILADGFGKLLDRVGEFLGVHAGWSPHRCPQSIASLTYSTPKASKTFPGPVPNAAYPEPTYSIPSATIAPGPPMAPPFALTP